MPERKQVYYPGDEVSMEEFDVNGIPKGYAPRATGKNTIVFVPQDEARKLDAERTIEQLPATPPRSAGDYVVDFASRVGRGLAVGAPTAAATWGALKGAPIPPLARAGVGAFAGAAEALRDASSPTRSSVVSSPVGIGVTEGMSRLAALPGLPPAVRLALSSGAGIGGILADKHTENTLNKLFGSKARNPLLPKDLKDAALEYGPASVLGLASGVGEIAAAARPAQFDALNELGIKLGLGPIFKGWQGSRSYKYDMAQGGAVKNAEVTAQAMGKGQQSALNAAETQGMRAEGSAVTASKGWDTTKKQLTEFVDQHYNAERTAIEGEINKLRSDLAKAPTPDPTLALSGISSPATAQQTALQNSLQDANARLTRLNRNHQVAAGKVESGKFSEFGQITNFLNNTRKLDDVQQEAWRNMVTAGKRAYSTHTEAQTSLNQATQVRGALRTTSNPDPKVQGFLTELSQSDPTEFMTRFHNNNTPMDIKISAVMKDIPDEVSRQNFRQLFIRDLLERSARTPGNMGYPTGKNTNLLKTTIEELGESGFSKLWEGLPADRAAKQGRALYEALQNLPTSPLSPAGHLIAATPWLVITSLGDLTSKSVLAAGLLTHGAMLSLPILLARIPRETTTLLNAVKRADLPTVNRVLNQMHRAGYLSGAIERAPLDYLQAAGEYRSAGGVNRGKDPKNIDPDGYYYMTRPKGPKVLPTQPPAAKPVP
jgi:hypothetical protein